MHIGECRGHEYIDAPEEVVLGDTLVETELIKQARLIARLPTHHDPPPTSPKKRNHCSLKISSLFRQHRPKADLNSDQDRRSTTDPMQQQELAIVRSIVDQLMGKD
jgi:hypothetical protein